MHHAIKYFAVWTLVLLFCAATWVAAFVLAMALSTPSHHHIQDCRLGPQDCGYADNGSNGDH